LRSRSSNLTKFFYCVFLNLFLTLFLIKLFLLFIFKLLKICWNDNLVIIILFFSILYTLYNIHKKMSENNWKYSPIMNCSSSFMNDHHKKMIITKKWWSFFNKGIISLLCDKSLKKIDHRENFLIISYSNKKILNTDWNSEDFCCIQISGQTTETIQVKFDIQVLQLISEAVSNFGIDTRIGTRDIRQISNGSKKKFLHFFNLTS
jgi:hypothetical protein